MSSVRAGAEGKGRSEAASLGARRWRDGAEGTVKIAWEEHGAGAPLLLIQGLGYARWGWEPVVPGLAESYRVLLFDNRGIGESDAPPGPYTAEELAADALQVLDEAGVERAHVVGTSLGGMVAQKLALDAAGRVDKLVLVCTTVGTRGVPMPDVTVKLMMAAASLPPEEALRRFVVNALGEGARNGIVERIMAHRLATAQSPAAWQAQAAAGMTFDVLDRVSEISAPTLVVTGTADNVVDPRNSDLLAEKIAGARLETFEGGGHIFFWEQPERFVRLVKDFLS